VRSRFRPRLCRRNRGELSPQQFYFDFFLASSSFEAAGHAKLVLCPGCSSFKNSFRWSLTNAPVRKGTRLIEYTGKFLTPDEADRLYEGAPRTYLYGLGDGKKIIDGEGIAAYLNHSCDPNCEIDEIKNRAYIFALRDIAAGKSCCGITTCMTMTIPRRAIAGRRNAGGRCIRGSG